MMSDHLLTVVTPLLDRASWTTKFLEHNLFSDFNYLFLDGSHSRANEQIIASHVSKSICYISFSPDMSNRDYFSKLSIGLREVKTPYCLLSDNDDLLLKHGLLACVEALQGSPDLISAGGPVLRYEGKGSPTSLFSWPVTNWRLFDSQGIKGVNQQRIKYHSIWYSTIKTEILSEGISLFLQRQIQDAYAFEFFLADYLLLRGGHKFVRTPHYARLNNQADRALTVHTSNYNPEAQQDTTQARLMAQSFDDIDDLLTSTFGIEIKKFYPNYLRLTQIEGRLREDGSWLTRDLRRLRNRFVRVPWMPYWLFRLALTMRSRWNFG